jgi:heme-degrading monooxygenase HmoA
MFVVLFEVQPHAAQTQQYLDYGKLLRPELEQIDGFIDNERFASTDTSGRILSLSTWRDEKALIRWRTHMQHHQVQEQGRALVFAGYRLRVGEVIADSAPPSGHNVRQQRFDETEISETKAITLIEIAPAAGDTIAAVQLTAATMIDPTHAPAGWIESQRFTSIYQPGKQAILDGWSSAEAAQAWHAQAIAPIAHPALRSRIVRIIRAYGMFDRNEAPQFYPAIASATLAW